MNHRHTLLPTVQIILPNQFLIVPVSDILEYISNEVISSLRKKGLQCRVKSILVRTVGNNQSLSRSATFQRGINCSLIIADQNVVLDQSLLADVPVEVTGYHVVFHALTLFVVRICYL